MQLHDILLASKVAQKNGENADLSDYYTKSQVNGLVSAKVDKIEDMGLSKNDFTDEEKSKLSTLKNYDDSEISLEVALNHDTIGYQQKNLLKNILSSKTASGVTITVSTDGSITLSGTATADILNLYISPNITVTGDFALTGCPAGGSATGYKLDAMETGVGVLASDVGQGTLIKKSAVKSGVISIRLRIGKGTTFDDVVFFPMLRYAEISDDTYEPYKPSVDERLAALEKLLLPQTEAVQNNDEKMENDAI